MEHYYRTALWMLFLIGCFQAAPITQINFKLLQTVKFEGNVTFEFPKDVSNSCLGEAVGTIIKGLEHAKNHANSDAGRFQCYRAIEALVHTIVPSNESSDCNMQEVSSLNFEDFLKKSKTIIDRINFNSKSN